MCSMSCATCKEKAEKCTSCDPATGEVLVEIDDDWFCQCDDDFLLVGSKCESCTDHPNEEYCKERSQK